MTKEKPGSADKTRQASDAEISVAGSERTEETVLDLATLIGLLGAFATVTAAIVMGGSPGSFIDVNSILIVFLGTILVTMMKFSLGQFASATKVAVKAFTNKLASPESLIEKAVELAKTARQGGLLALEEAEVPDEFMKTGIGLLVDGHPPEVVRMMLNKDKTQTQERHSNGQSIFKAIGDVGPAMGMIGTLIGLVQMLSAMDDPKMIGPAMAVALLTTLYGAILANMVALPIADKLGLRSKEEILRKTLIIDALLAIQEGQNPRIIESLLEAYLPPALRSSDAEEEA